jgi:hypothetical protein
MACCKARGQRFEDQQWTPSPLSLSLSLSLSLEWSRRLSLWQGDRCRSTQVVGSNPEIPKGKLALVRSRLHSPLPNYQVSLAPAPPHYLDNLFVLLLPPADLVRSADLSPSHTHRSAISFRLFLFHKWYEKYFTIRYIFFFP